MKEKLHRIFACGTLAIKFDNVVQNGMKIDDTIIVSNGQFDIPLKVNSANISPTYPDILNIEVSKIFSYVAEHKFTPRQLHRLNTRILNAENMVFDATQLPFEENVKASQLFWDLSAYHEMEDLDGEEFLYE